MAFYKTVTLSGGESCRVRQLSLFELDNKARQIIGPYKYSILLATGQVVESEYDLRALEAIPVKPDKPALEIENGSPEWYQLQEYETYLAAMAHEQTRIESYEGYVNDIAEYILSRCVEDSSVILNDDDWQKVYQAALVPQLTEEGISDTLRVTFPGYIWQPGDFGRVAIGSTGQGQDGGHQNVGA